MFNFARLCILVSFRLYFVAEKIYKIVVNIYNYNSKRTSYNILYKIEIIVRNLKKTRDVLSPLSSASGAMCLSVRFWTNNLRRSKHNYEMKKDSFNHDLTYCLKDSFRFDPRIKTFENQ